MAIEIGSIPSKNETVKVVVFIDPSIPKDVTRKEYDDYLASMDESLLKLHSGMHPTRFVLRRSLPTELHRKVKRSMGTFDEGKFNPDLNFMSETARCALIDIEYHESTPIEKRIKYEKGQDGGASHELMAFLDQINVTQDLFAAFNKSQESLVEGLKKS